MVSAALSIAALAAALAQAPAAQTPPVRVEAAVVPETVTVGSRFALRVRVHVEPGTRVAFPASLDSTDAVTGVGPAEVRVSGDTLWTADYESAAWEPGEHALPMPQVTVRGTEGFPSAVGVPAARVVVSSVLPAQGTPRPRGPKDVWGWSWAWWEMGLAVLGAAALVALVVWLRRRQRRRPLPLPRVHSDPKAVALTALDTLRQRGLGWLVRGDSKAYYTQLSLILRYYLELLREEWSPDLTTAELVVRLRADGVSSFHAFELSDVLGEADLVKFAPVRPTAQDAAALTARAREWVEEFEPPAPPAPEPEGALVGAGAAEGEGEGDAREGAAAEEAE